MFCVLSLKSFADIYWTFVNYSLFRHLNCLSSKYVKNYIHQRISLLCRQINTQQGRKL